MGSVEWQTVMSTVVGVIVGGLINWWFSRRALKQLVREAAWLRQITNLILRAMKEAGLASFNRNPETGEAEGLVIDLSSVFYYAAEGGQVYAEYIDDAAQEGDTELVEFFKELQEQDAWKAQKAKSLICRR